MSTLSDNLRFYRNLSGKTAARVSEECGIPAQTIYAWELGNRVPRDLDELDKLAESLNITKDMLLQDRSRPRPDARKLRLEAYARGIEQLNDAGRDKLMDYLEDLLNIEKYRKKDS